MIEPLTLEPCPDTSTFTPDFSKPKRLVEYVTEDPLYVLQEISLINRDEPYNTVYDKKLSHLLLDHQTNPMSVITGFYSSLSIDYVRRELWDWLHGSIACEGKYTGNMNECQALYTYETMQCLLEAAYGLFKRSTEPSEAIPASTGPLSLSEAITIIKEACNPDKIFQLQHIPAGPNQPLPEYAFLVLLSPSASRDYKTYQESIAEMSKDRAALSLFFEKTNAAYRALITGHIFYSVACTPLKMVYNGDHQPIPEPQQMVASTIVEATRSKFEQEKKKSNAFLDAVRHSFATGENNMATFLLHQAAESMLLGMLLTLTGEDYHTHNLVYLLQKSRCFTLGLRVAFPQNSPEEIALLQQLNNAYIQTRYRTGYTISNTELTKLVERVELLQSAVTQAVEEQLIRFETIFAHYK